MLEFEPSDSLDFIRRYQEKVLDLKFNFFRKYVKFCIASGVKSNKGGGGGSPLHEHLKFLTLLGKDSRTRICKQLCPNWIRSMWDISSHEKSLQ